MINAATRKKCTDFQLRTLDELVKLSHAFPRTPYPKSKRPMNEAEWQAHWRKVQEWQVEIEMKMREVPQYDTFFHIKRIVGRVSNNFPPNTLVVYFRFNLPDSWLDLIKPEYLPRVAGRQRILNSEDFTRFRQQFGCFGVMFDRIDELGLKYDPVRIGSTETTVSAGLAVMIPPSL